MDSHDKSGSSSSGADSSFGVLAMPYDEFDIMLTDINEAEMEKIGIAEEVKHLSPGTFSDPAFPVQGILHGPNSRLMIPLTFQRYRKPDSPIINTLEAFFGAGNVVGEMYYPFAIQDQSTRIECQVSRIGTHFEHVNIMGIDSLRKLKLNLDIDWDKDSFKLIKK
ncbi:unnamed protein product [Caenorhabditis auriculariae]|uniref:Uncharacterized protein n=1 Tax=Caenorhabditis auriculariae TaxID=2777116 RepID=A0A8S1HKI2_9PELO|nr:unnamed protein product [Caenorhabditis auriculariae]